MWGQHLPLEFRRTGDLSAARRNVTVTTDGGVTVRFGAGDLLVLDAGLSWTWEVHAPVSKHYRIGQELPAEWSRCRPASHHSP